MLGLDEYRRMVLAIALLERGSRVSIVHHVTGLPRVFIRRVYRELYGSPPHGGQLPTTATVMATRNRQVQASLWACLYLTFGGPQVRRRLDAVALMDSYDVYLQVLRGQKEVARLDINDAWVVARDLRGGTAEILSCARCQVCYLVCSEPRLPPSCPICALRGRGR